jgi:hypothetical protein
MVTCLRSRRGWGVQVKKLLTKFHPGLSNSKTEALINTEVERLMGMSKVTEEDLVEVENRVRKQSNDEVAFIATNPFKNVTASKSGATDEWAMMSVPGDPNFTANQGFFKLERCRSGLRRGS